MDARIGGKLKFHGKNKIMKQKKRFFFFEMLLNNKKMVSEWFLT